MNHPALTEEGVGEREVELVLVLLVRQQLFVQVRNAALAAALASEVGPKLVTSVPKPDAFIFWVTHEGDYLNAPWTYVGWAATMSGGRAGQRSGKKPAPNPAKRTLSRHHHQFIKSHCVKIRVDYFLSFCDASVLLTYKKHQLNLSLADTFLGERWMIQAMKQFMPKGRTQNTQLAGGGGTQLAMIASTAGAGQGVYAIYLAAMRRRQPGEKGNVPAPRAYIHTVAGECVEIEGGELAELGAEAFLDRGLDAVLSLVRS